MSAGRPPEEISCMEERPITSTAATTKFVWERLDGPGGLSLYLDGNQKVSGWDPKPNALSLLDRETCPFRTPTCEASCYIQHLAKAQPDLHQLYRHNTETLRSILRVGGRFNEWASVLAGWITKHAPDIGAAWPSGTGSAFRWHVSGDVESEWHAQWIRTVVRRSPSVRHWIYTRSFPHVEPLVGLPNLALNLSADRDNLWLARRYAEQHGLRICYMATSADDAPDLPEGSVVFPDYNLRPARGLSPTMARRDFDRSAKGVCPVDLYGKSEAVRCGPCRRCL